MIALESPRPHAPARRIPRVYLDHLLGQVNTYPRYRCSCNLVHGLPLFSFRLMLATQSWCFDTVTGRWEVPSYSRGNRCDEVVVVRCDGNSAMLTSEAIGLVH